jgi:Zn-dependent protease
MFLPRIDLTDLLLSLPALILALTVHEYAHAKAADKMGDPTPRAAGRLTLEPWAHLDPIGTILLVLYRFGWAKPVPINPRNFRDPRRGLLYTSLAGPASNFILATIAALIWAFAYPLLARVSHLTTIVEYIFILNIYFGVFNLIPIPPLDGSKVLITLLPGRQAYAFSRLEPYGPIILIIFLLSGLGSALIRTVAGALAGIIGNLAVHLAALLGLGG